MGYRSRADGGKSLMAAILIADDDADLRLLIRETLALSDPSYRFLEARDGLAALEIARQEKPDIILLDIVMPRMDGLELCRILKNDPATRFMPVIFLTALKDSEEKIKGVDVGGDDFVVKPFMPLELTLRVRSLLRIKQLHDEVSQHYSDLQKAHRELQRLGQWKDDLTHMIIHDMRTPLSSTQLGLQFVLQEVPDLPEPYRSTLEVAFSSVTQLTKMVNNLLDISRMEQGKLSLNKQPVDIGSIVAERIKELEALARVDGKTFVVDIPVGFPRISADRALVSRVLGNLLDNALQHATRESEISVTASLVPGDDRVRISVHNAGKAIPVEYQGAIFEKFRQVEGGSSRNGGGVGLGLAFCKMAVEAHGGRIWVESTPGHGATFSFELPLEPAVSGADRAK